MTCRTRHAVAGLGMSWHVQHDKMTTACHQDTSLSKRCLLIIKKKIVASPRRCWLSWTIIFHHLDDGNVMFESHIWKSFQYLKINLTWLIDCLTDWAIKCNNRTTSLPHRSMWSLKIKVNRQSDIDLMMGKTSLLYQAMWSLKLCYFFFHHLDNDCI